MPPKKQLGRFFKNMDGFGAPVKMYIHRNNADMRGQEPIDALGSKFGGVMSLIYYAFMTYYTLSLLVVMYTGQKDEIQSQPLTNNFKDEYRYIELTNENFMPHFEITQLNPNVDPKSFDIWSQTKNRGDIIDVAKLSKYIDILIDIQTKVDSPKEKYNRHIYKTFKNCDAEDFTARGYNGDGSFIKDVETLLCPDLSEGPEQFKVEGKYTNNTFRQSYSIEISVCNQTQSYCKNETEIARFLSAYYFTLYNLQKKLLFNNENLMTDPLVAERIFHSQFSLSLNSYRDQNSYFQVHRVITQDNRYFNDEQEFRFAEIQIYPAWSSMKKTSTSVVSFDHGKTYFTEYNRHILLGAYFFIGDIMYEDTRTVFDWFGLLSEFGGMQGIVIIIF